MSARVAKLEALLNRVQERAAQPRPVAAAPVAAAADEAVEVAELDEPELDPPEISQVELDPPELDEPELDAPELDAPEIAAAPESIDEIDEIDELEEVDIDEDLPESGVTADMDKAMEAAEHQPPLTPPPESGEGVTSPQIPAQEGPTMEQLGETIALDEGGAQDFELDEPDIEDEPTPAPTSEMEMDIPASAPPVQAQELQVPDNAREELERHRLGDSTPVEARVSTRPVLSTNVVELTEASKSYTPKTFLELLDSSLGLK